MSTVFPYTKNINRFREFFAGIQTHGKPDKVNQEYLKKLDFKSSNEQTFPSILKFIGLLDSSNSPTDKYDIVRQKTGSRELMATLIRSAYKELFEMYPNAQRESDAKIVAFMKPYLPKLDEKTIAYYARTFKILCEFADFEATPSESSPKPIDLNQSGSSTPQNTLNSQLSNLPLALNVNIQIELPNTDNYEIYEKIFQAIRRNLIDKE